MLQNCDFLDVVLIDGHYCTYLSFYWLVGPERLLREIGKFLTLVNDVGNPGDLIIPHIVNLCDAGKSPYEDTVGNPNILKIINLFFV